MQAFHRYRMRRKIDRLAARTGLPTYRELERHWLRRQERIAEARAAVNGSLAKIATKKVNVNVRTSVSVADLERALKERK